MSCEEMSERITESVTGALGATELAELREHLATCPGCAREAAELERLWVGLAGGDAAAEPSAELRRRFDEMLAEAIDADRRPLPFDRGRERRPSALSWRQLGAIAATLLVGVVAGSELSRRRGADELAGLRDDVRSLRETVAIALLDDLSASERLRGVSYGRDLSASDDQVAAALLDTLQNDPNVNVRLAALEALRPRAVRPDDRPRMIAAVARQDSPLVQLSLIELLLETGGEAARRDLAQLLDNPDLDPVARGFLRDRLGWRI